MQPYLLLFDIDGTLMLSANSGMHAMRATAESMFGPGFKWDGVTAAGRLDPHILSEAATLNGLDLSDRLDAFRDAYIARLATELVARAAQIEVMPGVIDLVHQLRDRAAAHQDVVLGVLTGNFAAAAPLKLQAIQLDVSWFPITAFGDEAPTRPDLVALAMQRYAARFGSEIPPDHVVVIGDTPHDVDCAKRNGCIAFAVATGHHAADVLHDAGADVVVENLADPTPLLNLLHPAANA